MKTALVYFTAFSNHVGGSEPLVFSLIRGLQRRGCRVTLALRGGGDFRRAAQAYGIDFDLDAVQVIRLSRTSKLLAMAERKLHVLWRLRLRQLGKAYDVCISCANPVDFGRPGIHFVHMMTLDSGYFNKVWFKDQGKAVPLKMRLAQWVDAVGRLIAGARSAQQIVRDSREMVLPNSDYVRRSIELYYGCRVHAAFYPPTLFDPIAPKNEDSLDVACIGRVGPEKKVLEIISIVEQAREISGKNLRLRIAGHVPPDHSYTDYGTRVRALAKDRPWIILEDVLVGEAKAKYLAECAFAVHHCEVEAFGIAVTEYLKVGIIPIVPVAGGSSEVVGNKNLVFSSDNDAARLLVRLVTDAPFRQACRERCRERANLFSASKYAERMTRLLVNLV